MPLKNISVPEAYCDVCGERWGEVCQCAICGGYFCEKHAVKIIIDRVYRGQVYGAMKRALCDNCIKKNPRFKKILEGKTALGWHPHSSEKVEDKKKHIKTITSAIEEE